MEREISLPMRLLQLVSYGGIRSTSELGRRLGVSEGLVTMMSEDLRRRGYLQAVSGGAATHGGSCDTGCASCGIANSCKLPGADTRLPLLVLTEKGKSVAAVVTCQAPHNNTLQSSHYLSAWSGATDPTAEASS